MSSETSQAQAQASGAEHKDTTAAQNQDANESQTTVNKNKRYRKDKPWDDESIDHWKIDPVTPDNPLPPPVEESSFATLFPKYRETYLREIWPIVTKALKDVGVDCELNLVEGSMTVRTTRKMYDPYMIIKARDLIKLLARSVPVQQALKILRDDMTCDIIKIKNLVRNKERFAKRRARLIGPNGCTLKAIELVTNCYVMVQGNTVAAMGSFKDLKQVRRIVLSCMNNIHPIYIIKELMIRKELEKDPLLKNESWDRFLPKLKKKSVKRYKPHVINDKTKERALFPPAPTPRKIDLEMESGEYWLKQDPERLAKVKQEEIAAKQAEKRAEKEEERAKLFTAPEEISHREKIRREKERAARGGDSDSEDDERHAAQSADYNDDDDDESQMKVDKKKTKKDKKDKKEKKTKDGDDEEEEEHKSSKRERKLTAELRKSVMVTAPGPAVVPAERDRKRDRERKATQTEEAQDTIKRVKQSSSSSSSSSSLKDLASKLKKSSAKMAEVDLQEYFAK